MDSELEEGKTWVSNKLRELIADNMAVDAFGWDDGQRTVDILVLCIWAGAKVTQVWIPKASIEYLCCSRPLQARITGQIAQALASTR